MLSLAQVQQEFLAAVEAYIAETDSNDTTFGSEAIGDPNFVKDLKAGRECRQATMDKVLAFMKGERGPHQAKKRKVA